MTGKENILEQHLTRDSSLERSHGRSQGQQALKALVENYLKQFAPFSGMSTESLGYLSRHLKLQMFPKGTEIMGPEVGSVRQLFILEKGKVLGQQVSELAVTEYTRINLQPGECFPIGAVTAGRPSTNRYTALTDAYCYVLPVENFRELMEISPEFNAFCTRYIADLLTQSRQQLQALFTQRASEQQTLNAALAGLVQKNNTLAVSPDMPLRAALEEMSRAKVRALVLVDQKQAPVGVLSRSDLLDRVVLPGISLEVPVGEVMTASPVTVGDHATAYDAMFTMAKQGVSQLLVVDHAGALLGTVSEKDLFALQRVGLQQIRSSIESADTVQILQSCVTDIRRLAFNMLAQGVGAEQLTQFISVLNDALTRRIITLNLESHDLFGLSWAWLAFGSEGRDEQTFSTDQDNGIVFLSDDLSEREAVRGRFLKFARAVNEDLDRCGFPLCKGNIMASNPDWCLSLDEWKEKFANWVRNPFPEALLNASIFFDFRTLYGEVELADKMHTHLLGLTTQSPLFLRAMAANALQVEPPLGTFRDFQTDLEPDHPGAIDLKKYGSRLFVDAARIFALATGVPNTNTAERLRLSGAKRSVNPEETKALIEALNFIQILRLRHQQLDDRPGEQGNNLIYPDKLNELDRHILKEAFRQAKKLQQRLKLDYQTG